LLGRDKCCSANDLRYGNGADQAQQPPEIFGHEWLRQGLIADLEAEASGTEGLPDRADGDARAVAERSRYTCLSSLFDEARVMVGFRGKIIATAFPGSLSATGPTNRARNR
jgi:Protein of unknown function (DUF3079)